MNIVSKWERPVSLKTYGRNPGEERKKKKKYKEERASFPEEEGEDPDTVAFKSRTNLSCTLRLQTRRDYRPSRPRKPILLTRQPQPGPVSPDTQSRALFTT